MFLLFETPPPLLTLFEQITNHRLAVFVGAIISVQILLLAIWQGAGPLHLYTIVEQVTYGSGTRPKLFNQCSIGAGLTSGGRVMLAMNSVWIGGLLLWGAKMSFATRQVSSTFNESTQAAWAICSFLRALLTED